MSLYKLSDEFPQKRAFITGAASGLGKALSLKLATDNWTIGLCDFHQDNLALTQHEVTALGGKAISYTLDVSDKIQYSTVVTEFLNRGKGIDLLINNAGVGDGGNVGEYTLENWEWMVGINQMGVVYGCHFFVPQFKKQQSGHIINIASLAAITCAPQMAAYNMTKAAVLALSETLYGELMDDNIHVSCVMPSYFKTNIAEGVRGGEQIKKVTSSFIKWSKLEADQVAEEILNRAGNHELYIVMAEKARKLWYLKRLMPTRFRRKVKEKYYQAVNRIK
jgi:short-subunit dehydrogenase